MDELTSKDHWLSTASVQPIAFGVVRSSQRRDVVPVGDSPTAADRVLIVSASIGGGHDGVAAELARRLDGAGVTSERTDFLDHLPAHLGWAGRRAYETALRVAPGSYEAVYQLWMRYDWLWRPLVHVLTLLSRRRLRRLIRQCDPAVVVSVYPLASLALGRMRSKGWLAVPVVTYLTDFSAHPLWIHPGVDLHLGISRTALDIAATRGATRCVRVRPLVRSEFHHRPERLAVRRTLGIGPHDTAVLLVSGSWGVGTIAHAVETIASFDGYRVICVCGRNEQLRSELAAQGTATAIGWTDQMAEIMNACDVLVENAGGLSCMEALASGLPVVTFDPIAGHGRHNAEVMAQEAVVTYARDRAELASALSSATHGGRDWSAMRELWTAPDAAELVRAEIDDDRRSHRAVRRPVALRRLGAVAAATIALYLGATTVFATAASHGVGADTSGTDANRATIVGVRVGTDQLTDPDVRSALSADGIVAVVDVRTACRGTGINFEGVALASTGDGDQHAMPWVAARDDVQAASVQIGRCTGVTPRWFVALRSPTAFDWVYARRTPGHRMLVPTTIRPDTDLVHLAPHHLYVIDVSGEPTINAIKTIARVNDARAARQISTIELTA